MQPRNRPRAYRKYIFASILLHGLLAAFLIHSYSGVQDRNEAPPSAPSGHPPAATAQVAPAGPARTPALQLAPELSLPQEGALQDAAPPGPEAPAAARQEGTKSPENTPSPRPSLETGKISGQALPPAAPEPQKKPPPPSTQAQRPQTPANTAEPKENTELASASDSPPPPPGPENPLIRAQLTTGIQGREPIDQAGPVIRFKEGSKRLYYFTEVKGMQGQTLVHRWEYEGKVIARVPLRIGGNQWRTYSSKNLAPAMAGRWQVVVTDAKGKTLHRDGFVYQDP